MGKLGCEVKSVLELLFTICVEVLVQCWVCECFKIGNYFDCVVECYNSKKSENKNLEEE